MPEDTDSPSPAAPEPSPPAAESEPEARTDRPSLARDLAEVQRGRPERAFNLGALAGVLVAAAAFVFVVQNAQRTEFDWLWLDFALPLWTALVGAMAVGALLVVLVFAVHERRQRRIGRRQDAAGRLRRALGPAGEPERGRSRRPFLRRSGRSPGPTRA